MSEDLPLAERLAEAARNLQTAPSASATMETAVQLAVSNIRHCDSASVTLVRRRGALETPSSSDSVALACDRLQYDLGDGPCLQAVWDEAVVHSPDLTDDARWGIWGPRVADEQGVLSVLCLRLFTEKDDIGALNLYSQRRDAFNEDDRDEGTALAAHIAVALAAAQAQENLTRALDARTLVGQAVGIVMERYGVNSAAAFQVLVRISSHSNLKLRDIAQELVDTGNLHGSERAAKPRTEIETEQQ